MRFPRGLALLLALSFGCARGPVATVATNEEPGKRAPVPLPIEPVPTTNKKDNPAKKDIAKPRPNPEVVRTSERGIIRGVVKWEGAVPNPPTPRLQVDAATHGVAQTVVWLMSPRKKAIQPPVEPVRLSVEQGAYRPHILLAPKGSNLELGTIEDRADFQASGAATFSEILRRGDRRTFLLSSPGLIEVRSQLQPQHTPAYIWVLDSGRGTLTESEGQFHLPPVDAGEYELMLWHEDWHSNEATPLQKLLPISLGANDGAEVRWTLSPRK
jgi:hypothetical protein